DHNDPTKVLYRSQHPILSPDMHYENDGKPGVVYASGTIVRGDDLYVYYGGGDKVVCVATTPLSKLLKYLKTGDESVYKLNKI
ncbi:MAG TPA: glycosidase, partial [Parcubacteria group bacterium]|nr:glycosidase [Parcubacteria group bacterium]